MIPALRRFLTDSGYQCWLNHSMVTNPVTILLLGLKVVFAQATGCDLNHTRSLSAFRVMNRVPVIFVRQHGPILTGIPIK